MQRRYYPCLAKEEVQVHALKTALDFGFDDRAPGIQHQAGVQLSLMQDASHILKIGTPSRTRM
jgi:hypothetical protein